MDTQITNEEACEIIKLLDDAPCELNDWAAKFVESNLDRTSFSSKQKAVIARLEYDYLEGHPKAGSSGTRKIEMPMSVAATLAIMASLKVKFKKGEKIESPIECPECNSKTLHVGIASNGHTRGKCETDKCLGWIE